MNLEQYKKRKAETIHPYELVRSFCTSCWQPEFNCFCSQIKKFDPKIEFVVLIHPLESHRRIATGRMSFLSLKNAHIIRGSEFKNNYKVNRLLSEKGYRNMILAPGRTAKDLTSMSNSEKEAEFTGDQKLRIFVIDGTWSNAKGMVNKTPELLKLPKICFTPPAPSNIRVRKQPNSNCYCTLEAIHHTIELIGHSQGFDVKSRLHDNLFKPFNWMVEGQLERLKAGKLWR